MNKRLFRLGRLKSHHEDGNQCTQAEGQLHNSERGSMVLEASLVLPIFLFFIVFLVYIVQTTLVSTALNTTVSDTTKEISSHMYMVAIAAEAVPGSPSSAPFLNMNFPQLSVQEWVADYSSFLPEPIKGWAEEAVSKGSEPLERLKNQMSEAVLDPIVKPIMKPFVQDSILDYERIHVSKVIVPNFGEQKNPYFGIQASYELPFRIPFLNKKIVLQSKAVERVWVGDTGEFAVNEKDNGEDDHGRVQIIAKPEPAYIGHNATIKVKVQPGTTAALSIFYKSGQSIAKHLGSQQADENGYIEWTWRVGSNTTPGSWKFVVETEDGQHAEVMFEARKKNGE
ncbi:pilus assembly protein [Paenibacillus sediminis]|uniref:Pilus assembly protein n=1 Tax=Paenibacillus sediminis TaxID=664909 RepID=A0ABS4H4Y2_9BACL|nr:pilus assembly protein [Paenibacillus sediminis]MBP1937437.1 hypothetical protein [Paenibacillus sediminis]